MKTEIKFVPSTPKTYEVRYVENKPSGLSPAARNKVIKMHGSDYLSSRATINSPSYGPGIDGAETTKWCSHCNANKDVSETSHKCPTCGTAFGTVAQKSKAQEQADKNTQVAAEKGGKSSYSSTTNKDGTVTETADYTKQ